MKKAVGLYKKAANGGDIESMTNLAICYEKGEGVEKDLKKAVGLYQKAADGGCAIAYFNLGVCLIRGIGVKEDRASGEKWIKKYFDST